MASCLLHIGKLEGFVHSGHLTLTCTRCSLASGHTAVVQRGYDPPSSPDLHCRAHLQTYPHVCVRNISSTPCDITFSLQHGTTPLLSASEFGHDECVKALLNRGAQTNLQDKVGTVQGWIQGFWKGVVVVWGRILLTS